MDQILVYGDSLSWGIIPGKRERWPFSKRWPGVLESELQRRELQVRIIEDCLNGRSTVLDDPVRPGRNGLIGLEQRIEVNSPLSHVIIMLGVNDFHTGHNFKANDTAQALGKLVAAIRRAPMEPGMTLPRILLVAPPPLQASRGPLAAKFANAEAKSAGLANAIRDVAMESGCEFFDAGMVTSTSTVDGVHLDEAQHHALGIALADVVARQLSHATVIEWTPSGEFKMTRQLVPARTPWASKIAYSRAVRAGSFVAVSQTSASDENGTIQGGADAYAQAIDAIDRVELALKAVGGELTDTIRVRICLANHADWEQVAKAYSERFREIQPAVSLYETPMVSADILVEFELDAVIQTQLRTTT